MKCPCCGNELKRTSTLSLRGWEVTYGCECGYYLRHFKTGVSEEKKDVNSDNYVDRRSISRYFVGACDSGQE